MNVVITGSTKGIGKGLALEFLNRQNKVLICGRSQALLDDIAAEQDNDKLFTYACDTTIKSDIDDLWHYAAKALGHVDIWINNAGLARTVWPILDTPDSEIESMVNTNILGTIRCCNIVARHMQKQGTGKLFNMLGGGSDGEYFPGMGIYGTTKRALDYFTNALAKELKDSGVIVGKIRPGMVVTEGVIREAQADLENFQKRRKFANILCDHVETVAPFLVDKMSCFNKPGAKIAWLSSTKITLRMLKGMIIKPQDKFSRYGL